ncbi:MAG: M50 family metallopeptidase [Actinobacteria bacterium]|nr:M50 family metallopeptidase [Actinomycetota bacterium]
MPNARDAAQGWNFRWGGLKVSVPWNALFGIGVIALLWYDQFAGLWGPVVQLALAVLFGVLLMVSILVHEFAHAYTAKLFGYNVTGVTLWAMGGFTTYQTDQKHGPAREAAIAAAGPVATLAIAAASWGLLFLTPPFSIISEIILALAAANLLVGLFNLLPGAPLDGGAIVKAIVWGVTGSERTGTVSAAWIGRGIAVLLAITPFGLALATGTQVSFILIAVCWVLAFILWTGASASLKRASATLELEELSAVSISRPVVSVPADATIAQTLPSLRSEVFVVAVNHDNQVVGVVSPEAARAVPVADRPQTPLAVALYRVNGVPTVEGDATARDVLEICQQYGSRYVAVVPQDGVPRLVDTDEAFVVEGP